MKHKLLKLTVLALAGLLASCMSPMIPIQFGASSDDRSIDRYIADQQYGRAIRALERRVKREPNQRNKMWLAQVRNNAKKFESGIIAKASHSIKIGKWQGAFVIVDDALHHYPESRRLNRYREQLSKKQSKSIKRARIKLVSARTDYLLRVIPVYQELNRLDPTDSDIAWKLKKTRLEISETAKSLSISGAQAIKQDDFEMAQQYLELADQLNPTQANTRALANLAQLRLQRLERQRRLAAQRKKQLANQPLSKHHRVQQQRLRHLTQQIRNALNRGNYDTASKLLLRVNHISQDHPEIAKLRLALDNSIHHKVSQLVHRGNDHYSKGRIEQAKRSWSRALKLDPKNPQIKSSVERADRVLSKLREIKNQRIN